MLKYTTLLFMIILLLLKNVHINIDNPVYKQFSMYKTKEFLIKFLLPKDIKANIIETDTEYIKLIRLLLFGNSIIKVEIEPIIDEKIIFI